jgi:hypothetical protein
VSPNPPIAREPLGPWRFMWATVAGVFLGTLYASSPVTVWFLVAMAGLFAWTCNGLTARERQWVMRLLGAAVALRLLAVAVLPLTSDPPTVGAFPWEPDSPSFKLRSLWIRDTWMGIPLPPVHANFAFDTSYGWTTFIYVLAYLQYLMGPAPYGVHLVNAALYMTTVVLLYRVARSAFGRESALLGFALLLFLPTPFAWSVSALKEPSFMFLAAVALTAAVTAWRTRRLMLRVFALVLVVGAVATIDGIRSNGSLLVGIGIAAGGIGAILGRRPVLMLVAPVILSVAIGYAITDTTVKSRIMGQIRLSADNHRGHVRTAGHYYKLLDERLYIFTGTSYPPIGTMTDAEAGRFLFRALFSIILFPLPWQMISRPELALLPQQIVWYGLVALATVGVFVGLRRDATVACMFAAIALVGAAGVAITSGNFGTMVRHRDMVMPFTVWFSALGAVTVASTLMARRDGVSRADHR